MKRFLSWLVLIGCYLVFALILYLDMLLLGYVLDLYNSLSAFLKLLILIFGGSFIVGLAVAPLWYGIPLMHLASERVCPSKKGLRYTVFGIYIVIAAGCEIITGFAFRDIFFIILGIALIVIGHATRKDYNMQITNQ